jgi:hypothetical protein
MKIVLFRRPYSCRARVSTFWRRKRLELGDKEGSGNPAQLERSRHAQHIVPVAKDQPGLEGAPDESANILIANAGVEPVELLISQVAQAGRKLQTQQVEQTG